MTNTTHPLYDERLPDWEQMRHTTAGERVVKAQGFRYLPPTSGMVAAGIASRNQEGSKEYQAYLCRALYPEVVSDAIESMLGVMHHKPPTIELPAALEPMRQEATLRGESLAMLMRRINEEQLTVGRIGLLGDIRSGEGERVPYIATYAAERAINWDDSSEVSSASEVTLVVLDEAGITRQGDSLAWSDRDQVRVLSIQGGAYVVGVFESDDKLDPSAMIAPRISGQTSAEIPFVFANTKDIVADPDKPPLLGLSNLSLAIYRGEADHRQTLFMQGASTLLREGAIDTETQQRVGPGATIDVELGGDARYVGVSADGLAEMRTQKENDYNRADSRANALLETVSRAAESGEALRVRVAARTASLNQIALTGAFALETLLRKLARWVGANPEEVVVVPNLDFVSDTLAGQELVALMSAKSIGAPISLRSLHELMQAKGLTERGFEEELAEIAREADAELGVPEPGSTNPEGPEL